MTATSNGGFRRFALGRPKVDELQVRFIADDNALSANLLAGAVDMTLGPGLSLEHGIQVRDRWSEGAMRTSFNFAISMNPQFLNPDPPVVANAQFRKALMMAEDRQQLADELMYGLSGVADSTLQPSEEEYKYVEPVIVKYAYDPARSAQMIEALGFRKGADGMLQDSTGSRCRSRSWRPRMIKMPSPRWRSSTPGSRSGSRPMPRW